MTGMPKAHRYPAFAPIDIPDRSWPSQVIVAATRNSAELLNVTDAGTIAARKSADFIVLDANPLDDITNTRRIAAVYLRGSQVDRASLRARWTSGKSQ